MHKADNLPPSCAVVMKSGNLNFLESSRPIQACNGTALPLRVTQNLQFSVCVCGVRVCVCVFKLQGLLNAY